MTGFVTIAEASKRLGLEVHWLRNRALRGAFPGAKKVAGVGWLIPERALDVYRDRLAKRAVLPIRVTPDERDRLTEICTTRADVLLACAQDGASSREIADRFATDYQTVNRWAKAWRDGDRRILG